MANIVSSRVKGDRTTKTIILSLENLLNLSLPSILNQTPLYSYQCFY